MDVREMVNTMIDESHLSQYFTKKARERAIQKVFVLERLLKPLKGSIRSRQIIALAIAEEMDLNARIKNIMDSF